MPACWRVGQSQALILGDDPASTSFLPEHGLFVRWCAAESEEELLGSLDAALADAAWGPEHLWDVPGPVILFDSAWPGDEVEPGTICGWNWSQGAMRFVPRMWNRIRRPGSTWFSFGVFRSDQPTRPSPGTTRFTVKEAEATGFAVNASIGWQRTQDNSQESHRKIDPSQRRLTILAEV